MIKKKTIILFEPKDKHRVVKGLEKLNMTTFDLSKQEHINNGYLSQVLNGKTTTNSDFVSMLWEKYHIRLHFTKQNKVIK